MPYDPVLERIKKLEKTDLNRKVMDVLDKISVTSALIAVKFGFDEKGQGKRLIKQWKEALGKKRWEEFLKEYQKKADPKDIMTGLRYSGLAETSQQKQWG